MRFELAGKKHVGKEHVGKKGADPKRADHTLGEHKLPSYALAIHPDAEREWGKLDDAIKRRFKQKLQKERLIRPRVAKDALHGVPDTYKIKIVTLQYRLAYHVDDKQGLVTILAVSTRDDVYALLAGRSV